MNAKKAIKTLLALQITTIVFHLCIILKLIPYNIAWGGRLQDDTQMYWFESISILILIILGITLLIRGGYLRQLISHRATNIILWVFMILFGLNTIGNLFATTLFEKFFSFLTLLYSILLIVVLQPFRKNNK